MALHNLFYPDNARICRRVRLVIYETGMTMNRGRVWFMRIVAYFEGLKLFYIVERMGLTSHE